MAASRRPRQPKPVLEEVPKVAELPRRPRVDAAVVARARQKSPRAALEPVPSFAAAVPPPGVLPRGADGRTVATMAQDTAIVDATAWAANNYYNSAFAEGTTFLGYSYLAALTQRPEYRVISEEIASEMTREWIELKRAGEENKSEKVQKLDDLINDKYKLRDMFRKAAEYDGFFGRGHIYVRLEGCDEDNDELKTSIGSGRDEASRAKVGKGKLLGFLPVEPVWTYPAQYNSTDPLKPDWYRPSTWYVMGKEVHRTRLLTFVGREMPDIFKPAYSFGGLAMSQMVKPYVDNWLRTRQSVSDLVHSFSVNVLGTNMGQNLQFGGDELFNRVDLFNTLRDNRGTMVIDKETETWANVSAPLGGLDHLQAQAQEHMAAISRIPIVKLLGIQPSGLNASSEGEIRSFYDWIKAFQHLMFGANLTAAIDFIQLSEYGEIDPAITFDFKDLWQLDETQKTSVEQQKATTHEAYVNMGAVGPEEVREAIAKDPDSPYAGLDMSGPPPEPPQPEGGGMSPMGGEAPPEGEEATDAENLDSWRRRAEALFSDHAELHRWSERAADLFDTPDPSPWAALAANLFETTNEPATMLQWVARVDRLRETWRQDGESWRTAAARIPRNVVEAPVAESFAAGGAGHVNWGDVRWDELGQDAAPGNSGEWSEESHPRDPKGKFAKAGAVSPQTEAALKKAGYKKHEGMPGTAMYTHPSGHHIGIYPPLKGSSYNNRYKLFSPGGAKPLPIKGVAALKEKLQELHGGETEKKDYTFKDFFPDKEEAKAAPSEEIGTISEIKPPGVTKPGLEGNSGIKTYSAKTGELVDVNPDGSWAIYRVPEGYNGPTIGVGQEALNAAFESMHPRGAGGQFEAKAGGVDIGGPKIKDAAVEAVLKQYGAKFVEKGISSATWEIPGGIKVSLFFDKGNPNFGVSKNGTYLGTGEEKGAEALANLLIAKPKPTGTVGAPIDPDKLTKTGGQIGSNPGGVYTDEATGQKYYVKQTQSADHAKNELLAAKLYQLAGAPTLDYHPAGDKGVATQWQDLGAKSVTDLTPEQRKAARLDFATHAWLANWDAAGLSNDNIGATKDGQHVNLDLGGALAYRAKGTPKGAAFGDTVGEWDTLRDPSKNPTSAALFKDMAPAEIVESAARIAKISDPEIHDRVMQIMGDNLEAKKLAYKLIDRRNDIIAKSKAEYQQKKDAPAPPSAAPTKTPSQIKDELAKDSPPRSSKVNSSIDSYKGSGYSLMNGCARFLDDCDDERVAAIDDYMMKTSLPATELYRGIPYDKVYIEKLKQMLKPGVKIPDAGFVSTSTSREFADGWRGKSHGQGLLFVIDVPEGSRGTVVRPNLHDGENEVLLHRGGRFVVKSYDSATGTVHVTLDQSKIKGNQS